MEKISEIKHEFHEYIPTQLVYGVLYISLLFKTATHLCACGCGGKTVTPLDEWKLTEKDGKITMRPSIGNWSGERPYHTHYYITNSKIEWL